MRRGLLLLFAVVFSAQTAPDAGCPCPDASKLVARLRAAGGKLEVAATREEARVSGAFNAYDFGLLVAARTCEWRRKTEPGAPCDPVSSAPVGPPQVLELPGPKKLRLVLLDMPHCGLDDSSAPVALVVNERFEVIDRHVAGCNEGDGGALHGASLRSDAGRIKSSWSDLRCDVESDPWRCFATYRVRELTVSKEGRFQTTADRRSFALSGRFLDPRTGEWLELVAPCWASTATCDRTQPPPLTVLYRKKGGAEQTLIVDRSSTDGTRSELVVLFPGKRTRYTLSVKTEPLNAIATAITSRGDDGSPVQTFVAVSEDRD